MSTDTKTLSAPAVSDLVSSVAVHLQRFPKSQRADALSVITRNLHEHEATELKYAWPLYARDSQLPPSGDWDTWLILAGRGFGKTRTGAEWVRAQSLPRTPIRGRRPPRNPHSPRRPNPARSTVHHDRGRVRNFEHIPALEPAHLRAVQAQNHLAQRSARPRLLQPRTRPAKRTTVRRRLVRRARLMGVRARDLGQPLLRPQARTTPRAVVTTTPKPIELIRSLPNRPGVHVTRGSTYDNKDMPPAFMNGIIDQYDGTRLGQQEIHAELMTRTKTPSGNASTSSIEKARLGSHPPISRIVVAVDPAMSTKPTSSETGIVVVGADMRRQHAYVLADESARLTPNSWALRVIHLYDKFGATMIVVEDNAGGQMAESTIQNAVERTLPIKRVRARQGKYVRAEPVAALYEQSLPRTLIRGPRPPRRPIPCPRRPDVYLDRRPRPIPLPRPRRRPRPRRHPAHPKPKPPHLLVNPTTVRPEGLP